MTRSDDVLHHVLKSAQGSTDNQGERRIIFCRAVLHVAVPHHGDGGRIRIPNPFANKLQRTT